jgi:choline dehydrogenase-like flavoprotein
MANINGITKEDRTYDAIVIGSGVSGGWAAKELCDKGVNTLVLERGGPIDHPQDYPTAEMDPWDFRFRGRLPQDERDRNPIVSRCYAYDDTTKHFFVKDEEHPYVQEKPFDWIRGYQVGGKSLIWARQGQRWSRYDFEGPARDGYGIEWPISYDDLAPWYSHVEKFVGWSGNMDGLEHLPDGDFLPPFEMNCVEKSVKERIESRWNDRHVLHGRCAHLTEIRDIHREQGRGMCLARNLCYRGCPYGAYFSSNSSTLPWAQRTGNLTLRPHSVVHSIIYDEEKGKATGVRVIDAETGEQINYHARIIFVNAACLNSNLILLNSTSSRFPEGLGNDNGLLGRYIAFHNYRGTINASVEGFEDRYFYGRRPTSAIMPPFRNVYRQDSDADFQGKYLIAFSAGRQGWTRGTWSEKVGAELKEEMAVPGSWTLFMMIQGETVPIYENHVRLSDTRTDSWGIPQLVTSVEYTDNDEKMSRDFFEQGSEMLNEAGLKNIRTNNNQQAPGLDIHEIGGVRMGKDPETSLLNEFNQMHNCKNVFVTDGASLSSVAVQNPSLTFMALTARAANYAADEMKKGTL